MIFNVAGLLKDNSGSARKYRIEQESLTSEVHGTYTDIAGTVILMRTDRTVLVTGDLEASSVQTCSRCLEPATLELRARIEEEYHPVNKDLGGQQRSSEYAEDPLDPVLWIDDRNNLDISDAVLQSFAGLTPIAPLCKPDCKGICLVCKVDRNKVACNCRQTAGPRWEALANLGSFQANSHN
jgi:uncharacterized metal-binding protein YceD (DUF177 family)